VFKGELWRAKASEGDLVTLTYSVLGRAKESYVVLRSKDLNVRPETIKLLKENIGKTLSDINHSRILYDPPPRVMEIKAKINKWDLINLKSFCTMKETISKVKRQPSEWEKIIANKAADKESQKYTSNSCNSIPEK